MSAAAIPPVIGGTRGARTARWLRANLFSSPGNAAITVAVTIALAWLGGKFFAWAVLDAAWGKVGVAACNAMNGQGACWAVVAEKWRQMLFGIYPQA